VEVVGGFQTMYLNAILASIVILTLFEPLRDKVETYIHLAFRELLDLERAVTRARRELAHVLEPDEMFQVVVGILEDSRRATVAAVYMLDPMDGSFVRRAAFGREAPERLDGTSLGPLAERLGTAASVSLEQVMEAALERQGAIAEAKADERLLAAAERLGVFRQGLCLAIRAGHQELVGMLLLADDRMSDAFSGEDVSLLEALVIQMGVVVENSRQYRRLQERDRLAALGQMAAGLAHEVKNPLGAIKGAAQLLGDPPEGSELDATSREFVGIILEEVDRLDRVVGSVLDYARPSKGNPGAVDVNAAVTRTMQLLASSREPGTRFQTALSEDLPMVRADEEQLRQILINLVRNAIEAMPGGGSVVVTSRRRLVPQGPARVEIAVQDSGPGIPAHIRENVFVPFFTTKERGTGLGLAISQRVVQEMGGWIEVASEEGAGALFTVVLPAVTETPTPRPVSLAPKGMEGKGVRATAAGRSA
jgi:two-component system, NtrC family, sensor histidine kinase HydH